MFLAIDLDGTLYNDAAARTAYLGLIEQLLRDLRAPIPGDIKRFQKELREKWGAASTAIALSLEFAIPIAEIVQALYLPIDLDACAVPRDNPEIRIVLTSVNAIRVVTSASPVDYVRKVVTHLGIADCFNELLGCEDLPLGKESSETYAYLSRRHPGHDRYVLVDDSIHNITTALQAGWGAIHVSTDESSGETQIPHIHSISELATVI